MSNYYKKIIFGSGFVFIMGLLAAVFSYFTRIILARNLSPAEYGLFFAVFTFVSFLMFFRDLGLHTAQVKYMAEYNANNEVNKTNTVVKSVFLMQLVASFIFVLFILVSANYLAENYFRSSSAIPVLHWLMFFVVGNVLFRVVRATFNGMQATKMFAITMPLKNGIILAIVAFLIQKGLKVGAPTYAFAFSGIISGLILLPFVFKYLPLHRLKMVDFWSTSKNVFLFGLPVFASGMAGKFISNIDTLILTHFRTLSEVGVYNAILPTAMIFLTFAQSLSAVIFPIVTKFWTNKDKRLQQLVRQLYKHTFTLITPIAMSIIVFSNLIIKTLFGTNYISGVFAMQILFLGTLIFTLASTSNAILTAIGKPKVVAKIIIISAFANIIVNLLLIPNFGITGAAIATTLSYLITFVMATRKIKENIAVGFSKNMMIKNILAGACFFTVALISTRYLQLNIWLEAIISLTFAFVVYSFFIFKIKIISVKEIKDFVGYLK